MLEGQIVVKRERESALINYSGEKREYSYRLSVCQSRDVSRCRKQRSTRAATIFDDLLLSIR